MKALALSLALGLALLLGATPAFAMGEETKPDVAVDFEKAKKEIAAGQYDRALKFLETLTLADWRDPDAHNLIGYSYCKKGDLKRASESYKLAIKFDPDHKGALEYQGELFLKLGQLDAATRNLAHLQSLCKSGCKELSELRRSIADY